jgi:hypothetical protein
VERIPERETLIEVHHELDVVADRAANRCDGLEVVLQVVSAQAQLERREAALGDEFARLRAQGRDVGQPQAVAVVGRHRRQRAAEEDGERHARRLGKRIPRGHVEARHRDHGDAFVADEVQ